MTRDDETPVERRLLDTTEHLCYLQADSDAVRVWRLGNANDCAVCKAHEEKARS